MLWMKTLARPIIQPLWNASLIMNLNNLCHLSIKSCVSLLSCVYFGSNSLYTYTFPYADLAQLSAIQPAPQAVTSPQSPVTTTPVTRRNRPPSIQPVRSSPLTPPYEQDMQGGAFGARPRSRHSSGNPPGVRGTIVVYLMLDLWTCLNLSGDSLESLPHVFLDLDLGLASIIDCVMLYLHVSRPDWRVFVWLRSWMFWLVGFGVTNISGWATYWHLNESKRGPNFVCFSTTEAKGTRKKMLHQGLGLVH